MMSPSGSDRDVHPGNPLAESSLVGGCLCLDFANTLASRPSARPRDRLDSVESLIWWGDRAGVVPSDGVESMLRSASRRKEEAGAVLRRAVVLRGLVRRIFSAIAGGGEPDGRDIQRLNARLSAALAHRRIVPAGGAYRLDWARTETPEWILWPVTRSAAELLASDTLDRVGTCAADGCEWLFVDRSRNRSRRWCDMSDCGNRAKARRHYRRHRT